MDNNKTPEHLTTYIDYIIESALFVFNRQSGICGMPNILIWAWYFWKKDIEDGYCTYDSDYYLRQQFKKLIYRLNQPFVRVEKFVLTSISIFDRPRLKALIGGVVFPDGTLAIDHIEDLINCQKVFIEVINEIRSSNLPSDMLIIYPILTYSLLRVDGKLVDEDFTKWIKEHGELIGYETFETDTVCQKWDSECWIRYNTFKNDMNRRLKEINRWLKENDERN